MALVSGDPVGDPAAAPALLADFARHCHAHAWRVAALGVAPQHLDDWHAIGLRTIYVGDEAVVHPARFSLEGRPIRKVRQSVTRLRKAGHSARIVRARELTLEQRREIERVSRTWLRGQPERGFSMALDDMHAPDHGDAVFALGYDRARRLVGFVHFVPAPASGDLSLSAMRRLHHTPNGLMEFLLCETFEWAGGRGIERISLNFNAFGDLLRSDAKLPAWERGAALRAGARRPLLPGRAPARLQPQVLPRLGAALRGLRALLRPPAGGARPALDGEPRGLARGAAAAVAARLAGTGRSGRRPRHLTRRPCRAPAPSDGRRTL